MPDEGKVQIVRRSLVIPTGARPISTPVEMGAKGEAVELLGIHTSLFNFSSLDTFTLITALSFNPSHEQLTPTDRIAMIADPALYGTSLSFKSEDLTVEGGRVYEQNTQIIPLYGLVRPRRQILVVLYTSIGATGHIRIEIYYRPIRLSKVDLDSLNLKFGKYRRHA